MTHAIPPLPTQQDLEPQDFAHSESLSSQTHKAAGVSDPPPSQNTSSLDQGIAVIKAHLKTLPNTPGVYRMLSANGEALYIGKAKDLRKRVASYTRAAKLTTRHVRMISATVTMEFAHTKTEVEALLLESNMIKQLKPRFNVLMRDDKSFPYLHITRDHPFPELRKHRGTRKRKGDYFGPFAGAGAVNQTLIVLQKAFMLRSCNDNVFRGRERPCLQYHIKRCTAPCVGFASETDYAAQVAMAERFLRGHETEIQANLAKEMQEASAAMEFEIAAALRDRIRALTGLQARQDINLPNIQDADIFALVRKGGTTCVQLFFLRHGRSCGSHAYFPRCSNEDQDSQIIAAFLAQFYEGHPIPPLILTNVKPEERNLLTEALHQRAERPVHLHTPQRGNKKRLVENAVVNAKEAISRKVANAASQKVLLSEVANLFDLESPPKRIEVYDNSHIQGAHAVGAMIVAGAEGFEKTSYRSFNIPRDIASGGASMLGGDDFAMMRQVIERRFNKIAKQDPERKSDTWPDLLLIDGGKGQLSSVLSVFQDLGLTDIPVVAISKGPDRDAGREWLHQDGKEPIQLPVNAPVLYYLQRLRDEAHRFAIGRHRYQRKKAIKTSPLDQIEGVGPTRKRALLHHFGSSDEVIRARLSDLEKVKGISQTLARTIHNFFHE